MFFEFFQPFKNVKIILSSQATQTQAVGQIWAVGCVLASLGAIVG